MISVVNAERPASYERKLAKEGDGLIIINKQISYLVRQLINYTKRKKEKKNDHQIKQKQPQSWRLRIDISQISL